MTTHWATTTLGRAGVWVSGGTPSTSTSEFWDGDIPWMSSKSLTEFYVRDSDRRVTERGAANGTRLVPENTILMVVRGMSLKTEFRMGITRREVALSQDLKGLLPSDGFDPLFLAYAIRARTRDILDMVDEAGHGTGRLQTDRLFALELPVPPMPEQRSIAATLGALDDKIGWVLQVAERERFLAITRLSNGDERVRVGDVAELQKGLSYKGSGLNDGSSPNALKMINLGNFSLNGAPKLDGTKYYTGDYKSKNLLSTWDLVVANTDLTQDREVLGRGFLVPSVLDGAIHTHHTSAVRFTSRPELALVLWAQLQSLDFRDRAKGYATGTTVTALPPAAVLDFEVRVPEDLERKLESARSLIEHSWQLESEAAALRRTRDALLPELLSGRVRVPAEAAA
ncbi:restriction endonuclease subunit S [Protaetiibacter sp. SSC-01]|uniref:restriction endonuclease subunit S n=1 Tax=Protaetiibacter sp. SSC-01 TaxID=2759943 RepID=UPI001656C229|nr:restriction endonuclease subunit S [Protaetiibacter sp. SSC-01]QNO38659.1 restriction endonuclease subunit S [Protaetiibacter sp. SSC-01]